MPSDTHLNFDILFHSARDGYAAHLLRPLVGNASARFTLPFTENELAGFIGTSNLPFRHIKLSSQSEQKPQLSAQLFGEQLYRAVFAGALGVELVRSLDLARRQGKGLRIRISFADDATELAILPWEYLYSPEWGRVLTLSEETPVVRYIDVPQVTQELIVRPPLRILAVLSDPTDVPALQVENEWSLLQKALGGLESLHQITVERLSTPTFEALQTRLRGSPVHILHFIGHGYFDSENNKSGLILENENRQAHPVDAARLGALLHDHSSLRLAFLNACEGARSTSTNIFTGIAQHLVQQEVPSIVAMQFPISDGAALTLARTFYTSLAGGTPIDTALTIARKAIFGATSGAEWGTPVLFSRSPTYHLVRIEKPIIRKSYEPEMVLVAEGSFWMGSDPAPNIPITETPRHQIPSTDVPAYYISKYPITNAQYAAYLENSGRLAPAELGFLGNKVVRERQNNPVAGVTWNEAVAYCEWLSKETERNYSLPNEAQWEKAARGNDGLIFPWGNEWDETRCNITSAITAVDTYPQGISPYDCLDMVGNVREWTSTLWGDRESMPDTEYLHPWKPDDRNSLTANQRIRRVVKGGSQWEPTPLRAALRGSEYPTTRGLVGERIGFRVVLKLEE